MDTNPFKSRCRIRSFVIPADFRPHGLSFKAIYRTKSGEYKFDKYEVVGSQNRGFLGEFLKYELVERADIR